MSLVPGNAGQYTMCPDGVQTNTINEYTLATGITIDGVKCKDGGVTLLTSGGTPAVLDWYENGTFSPIFKGGSSDPSPNYGTRIGKFTRIGNLVFVTLDVNLLSSSGGSGTFYLSGLPYSGVGGYGHPSAPITWYSSGLTVSDYNIYMVVGGTNMYPMYQNGGEWANITYAQLSVGGNFTISSSFWYHTA